MINLSLAIYNPWHDEKNSPFVNYKCWSGFLTKNKGWEVELTHYTHTLFEFGLNLRCTRMDHAGPSVEISVVGYSFRAAVNDFRHWNFEQKRWMNYDNAGNAS